jgi:hypothetical protein
MLTNTSLRHEAMGLNLLRARQIAIGKMKAIKPLTCSRELVKTRQSESSRGWDGLRGWHRDLGGEQDAFTRKTDAAGKKNDMHQSSRSQVPAFIAMLQELKIVWLDAQWDAAEV